MSSTAGELDIGAKRAREVSGVLIASDPTASALRAEPSLSSDEVKPKVRLLTYTWFC